MEIKNRTVRVEGDGSFPAYDSYYQVTHGQFADVNGEWVDMSGAPVGLKAMTSGWFARGCNPGGTEWTPWVGPAETEDEALALAMAEYEE